MGIVKRGVVPFVAGMTAGFAFEPVAIEAYAHHHLAHATQNMNSVLGRVAHGSLIVCGMSPNAYAANHRNHHRINNLEPATGIAGVIRQLRVMGFGRGDQARLQPVLFDEVKIADDPLFGMDDNDEVVLRNNPSIDRLVQKGFPFNALPALSVVGGISSARGGLRKVPESAALVTGFVAGLSANALYTAICEARGGYSDSNKQVKSLGKKQNARLQKHLDHHQNPTNRFHATTRYGRAVLRLLDKMKLTSALGS